MVVFVLFLIIELLCIVQATGNIKCDTSGEFQRNIELVGDPLCKVIVSWQSPIALGPDLVNYGIHYFKTTRDKVCNCQTARKELIHPYCTRQSSKPGEWLQCVLDKKTVYDLNISFLNMEALCIVIETNFNNRTNYTFDGCVSPFDSNGPHCKSTCSPPEGFRVKPFKNRTLTVEFDSPKCVHGKGRFDIAYKILYKQVRDSTFHDILVSNNLSGFEEKNNKYDIKSLAPATKYEVKMCCVFQTSFNQGCSRHSHSYIASTLEEAPSRPPRVIKASRMGESLKFTFKNPPRGARNGDIIMYGFEIWRSDTNKCTAEFDYRKTFIKKNLTTQDIHKSEIDIFYPLKHHGNYCLHVKVRNSVAWSPWSASHYFPEDEAPQIETSRTPSVKSNVVGVAVGVSVAVFALIIVAAFIIWHSCCRGKQNRQDQTFPTKIFPDGDTDSTDLSSTEDPDYRYEEARPTPIETV